MASVRDRELLKSAYPSKRWSQKVDRMTDEQVIAVLRRLQSQGKV